MALVRLMWWSWRWQRARHVAMRQKARRRTLALLLGAAGLLGEAPEDVARVHALWLGAGLAARSALRSRSPRPGPEGVRALRWLKVLGEGQAVPVATALLAWRAIAQGAVPSRRARPKQA
ncbi:MAG: hypothetical protein K6U14_08555 [Firmicutes bacterium]|nr:hypothetical protein [Alicyclobacillaceae bacterium]MCL6497659.1 hypothetical protein [Bacillota bacterium]